eukprot:1322774-Pleurochrysis_carterae.AAC.2
MDSCSTPASAAAMHATPMPKKTRVTRTAHGNGVRPHQLWCLHLHCIRPNAVCVPSPPAPHGASEHASHWLQGAAHAAGERDRRQQRADRVAPYDYAYYAGAVASHRLTVKSPRRRHAKRSRRSCAGGGWPLRPMSLDFPASHAAFAQLTLPPSYHQGPR